MIDQTFVAHKFPEDELISEGQYEFPFELYIPDWLNESVMMQQYENNFSLTFYLTA